VETLNTLAALLRFFGRAEIRGRALVFAAGRGERMVPVAFANPANAAVIYAWGDCPARTIGRGEDLAKVATAIVERSIRAAA
jgi:hypothetical protein